MEQLGIEPRLLVAQVVNFLIIMVVLTKLLYKPILAVLEKRKREIEEGLVLGEKLRNEEEKLKEKKAKVLEEARREARTILEEAKKQGQEVEKEIIAQAHREAGEVIEKGKVEVARLHTQLARDIRKEAVTLGALIAKRLISSALGSSDHHKLIDRQLKALQSQREFPSP